MSAPVMLAIAATTLTLGLAVVTAASALEASTRAAGAADAAALAAADALTGYIAATPCDLAEAIASEANAKLTGCEVDAADGQVRISMSVQTIFGSAHSRARAGPGVA